MSQYSDYIIYVDESGDHNLKRTDPDYPMFVLAFCIIKKTDYYTDISPAIQRLKFDFFGHDMVIFHEHEIRKEQPPFSMLRLPDVRNRFMGRMSDLVEQAPFTLIACAINKTNLNGQYAEPENPYPLALQFCLERAYSFLKDAGQAQAVTHVVVEARGKKEDRDLELEFLRICQGRNYHNKPYPFEIVITDKKCNSGGLQLADLLARPIGIHVLNPQQPNRAYAIIERKFRKSADGKVQGWGLKIFP